MMRWFFDVVSIQYGGQFGQPLTLNTHAHPLALHNGANALIELDGWFVPLEDTPVQTSAIHGHDLLRQLNQQTLSIPSFPLALLDVQVLEVDARFGAPCAVVVEIQCNAGFDAFRRSQYQTSGRLGGGDGFGCC